MHFLARIAIADQNLFQNLMSASATPQKTEEDIYEELLEIWFARVSSNDTHQCDKIYSLVLQGRQHVRTSSS
jgi:hypothetical protein